MVDREGKKLKDWAEYWEQRKVFFVAIITMWGKEGEHNTSDQIYIEISLCL